MRINTIWVTGAHGRLGSTIVRYLDPLDAEIIATDKDEVDITDQKEVNLFVDRNRPKIIINASGLSKRRECEENPNLAFLLNSLGARNIAVAAQRNRTKLIQLSTADVYDGKTINPYKEFDKPSPVSVYGKSKFMGEEYIRQFSNSYFILRVSRLYSKENGIVESIIKSAKDYGKVIVPESKFASPTSAYELSNFLIKLMQTSSYGTYHASCKGFCSHKAFAEKILELCNLDAIIEEKRFKDDVELEPSFRGLDNYLLSISNMDTFSTWQDALEDYLKKELDYGN